MSVRLWGVRTWLIGLAAAAPVLWAALAPRPARLSVAEAGIALAVLVAAAVLVHGRPAAALALAVAGWQLTYLSRAVLDSTLGAAAMAGALAGVAYLAGREAQDGRGGAAVLAVGAGTAVVGGVAWAGGADSALAGAVGTLVLAAVPWSVGRYRREYAGMLRAGWAGWERAERLEREAELLEARAMAKERARLAGEMHDLVGHELAHVALRIGALEVDPTLDAAHRESARAARAGVTAAAERLADAVTLLGSGRAEPGEPLTELVARSRAAGVAVSLVETGEGRPDPIIERTVHRVVAEALTNVVKHAPGAAAEVAVERGARGTQVRVANGPPAAPLPAQVGGGHGLLGLAERVRLVGGRFSAEPAGDGGFAVFARLPRVPAPAAEADPAAGGPFARRQERVRRSAHRAVAAAAGVSVAAAAAIAGFMLFDAATSVLPAQDLARLSVGQDERSVAAVLPWRTRVDGGPDGAPPAPPGAACRYYGAQANPFGARGGDLHRLCFRDGLLVATDVVVRGRAG